MKKLYTVKIPNIRRFKRNDGDNNLVSGGLTARQRAHETLQPIQEIKTRNPGLVQFKSSYQTATGIPSGACLRSLLRPSMYDEEDEVAMEARSPSPGPSEPQLNTLRRQRNAWLAARKKPGVDFSPAQLVKLKRYFDQLDDDGGGSISADELEIPLISMNICRSREEVENVIYSVTGQKNSEIGFPQFLILIKGAAGGGQKLKIEDTKDNFLSSKGRIEAMIEKQK